MASSPRGLLGIPAFRAPDPASELHLLTGRAVTHRRTRHVVAPDRRNIAFPGPAEIVIAPVSFDQPVHAAGMATLGVDRRTPGPAERLDRRCAVRHDDDGSSARTSGAERNTWRT